MELLSLGGLDYVNRSAIESNQIKYVKLQKENPFCHLRIEYQTSPNPSHHLHIGNDMSWELSRHRLPMDFEKTLNNTIKQQLGPFSLGDLSRHTTQFISDYKNSLRLGKLEIQSQYLDMRNFSGDRSLLFESICHVLVILIRNLNCTPLIFYLLSNMPNITIGNIQSSEWKRGTFSNFVEIVKFDILLPMQDVLLREIQPPKQEQLPRLILSNIDTLAAVNSFQTWMNDQHDMSMDGVLEPGTKMGLLWMSRFYPIHPNFNCPIICYMCNLDNFSAERELILKTINP